MMPRFGPLLHRGLHRGPVAMMGHVGSCSFFLMRLPAVHTPFYPYFNSVARYIFQITNLIPCPSKKKKKKEREPILLESVVEKKTPLTARVVSTLPASPLPQPLCTSHTGLVPVPQICQFLSVTEPVCPPDHIPQSLSHPTRSPVQHV